MKIEHHTITEDSQGQRLDNYLMRVLRGAPKSLIYRMIRKGEVRINKKRAEALDRLELGDIVRVPQVLETTQKPDLSKLDFSWIKSAVLYEDESLLILNKPPGIAVHGGSQLQYGLIDGVKLVYPECPSIELAHRIDRDTSGCLVLAKKRSILKQLHILFQERVIQKTYHAVVVGRWPKQHSSVTVPLKRVTHGSGDRIVTSCDGEDEGAQEAYTTFEPLILKDALSLIAAHPHTGRTHQIRVHTLHVGHPILGDEKYCKRQLQEHLPEALKPKRLYLHAAKIQFAHPITQQKISVQAPYDALFELMVRRIQEI